LTLLARLGELAAERYAEAGEAAWRLTVDLLAPGPHTPIPRTAIERLLKRALRNGSWHRLAREQRALLLAAARAPIHVYRSPTLVEALRTIWAAVEMATARGKAVYTAILHLLATGAAGLLEKLARSLDKLLALGLQLLNHPWLKPL
jgi:hypothetical protein